MATLPTFLLIGAAKAGTTSLYHYLKQHPDVFVTAEKEPGFFAFEDDPLRYRGPGDERLRTFVTTTLSAYTALFQPRRHEAAAGEASVVYLYDAEAPERIRRYVPDVRLVAVLRHPVERAFSLFLDHRKAQREPCSLFAEAVAAEPERIQAGWEWSWHYVQHGFYHQQLVRYYDRFSADQIRVYLYEDLCERPHDLLSDLFAFLGVDRTFRPDLTARHNVSGFPRNRLIEAALKRPNPFKHLVQRTTPLAWRRRLTRTRWFQRATLRKPSLPGEVACDLTARYRDDILRLQDLIDRDLSHWLRTPS